MHIKAHMPYTLRHICHEYTQCYCLGLRLVSCLAKAIDSTFKLEKQGIRQKTHTDHRDQVLQPSLFMNTESLTGSALLPWYITHDNSNTQHYTKWVTQHSSPNVFNLWGLHSRQCSYQLACVQLSNYKFETVFQNFLPTHQDVQYSTYLTPTHNNIIRHIVYI